MIPLGRVAHLDAIHRPLRQCGFDAHHVIGFCDGLVPGVAEQRKHLLHVVDILRADLDEALVRIQIIVAVGEGETALTGRCDLLRAVLLVLRDANAKEATAAALFLFRVVGGKLAGSRQRCNGFELGIQGLRSQFVDELRVHARSEIITVLLLQSGLRRIGRGLQLGIEQIVIALGEFVEPSPAGLVGGNRIVLAPVAARVLVEVGTGIGGLIDRRNVEAERLFGD